MPGLPTKTLYAPLLPYVPHAAPISFSYYRRNGRVLYHPETSIIIYQSTWPNAVEYLDFQLRSV